MKVLLVGTTELETDTRDPGGTQSVGIALMDDAATAVAAGAACIVINVTAKSLVYGVIDEKGNKLASAVFTHRELLLPVLSAQASSKGS